MKIAVDPVFKPPKLRIGLWPSLSFLDPGGRPGPRPEEGLLDFPGDLGGLPRPGDVQLSCFGGRPGDLEGVFVGELFGGRPRFFPDDVTTGTGVVLRASGEEGGRDGEGEGGEGVAMVRG